MENYPTVLNTAPSYLSYITSCIGVSLGKNEEEIAQTISMIQDLEQARCNLFLSSKRKDEIKESDKGTKLDSFDPKAAHDLLSDENFRHGC